MPGASCGCCELPLAETVRIHGGFGAGETWKTWRFWKHSWTKLGRNPYLDMVKSIQWYTPLWVKLQHDISPRRRHNFFPAEGEDWDGVAGEFQWPCRCGGVCGDLHVTTLLKVQPLGGDSGFCAAEHCDQRGRVRSCLWDSDGDMACVPWCGAQYISSQVWGQA